MDLRFQHRLIIGAAVVIEYSYGGRRAHSQYLGAIGPFSDERSCLGYLRNLTDNDSCTDQVDADVAAPVRQP